MKTLEQKIADSEAAMLAADAAGDTDTARMHADMLQSFVLMLRNARGIPEPKGARTTRAPKGSTRHETKRGRWTEY